MLGELVIEDNGKITGQRVLEVVEGPKIEVSFSMIGKYKGIEGNDIGTYGTVPRPGGVMYGEGQGVGRSSRPGGKISHRGSLFFRTTSSANLSALNNLVGVFEYEVDEMGNCSSKVWEWK
jgi:hypothetical protein